MTPTNSEIAAALEEIASTLPLGPALIVRLAAERLPLGAECMDPDADEGWIDWDCRKASGPILPEGAVIEVRFRDGSVSSEMNCPSRLEWGEFGEGTIVAYRIVK